MIPLFIWLHAHKDSSSRKIRHLSSLWVKPLSFLVTRDDDWEPCLHAWLFTHDLSKRLHSLPWGPCSRRGLLLSLAQHTAGHHLSKHGIPQPTSPHCSCSASSTVCGLGLGKHQRKTVQGSTCVLKRVWPWKRQYFITSGLFIFLEEASLSSHSVLRATGEDTEKETDDLEGGTN